MSKYPSQTYRSVLEALDEDGLRVNLDATPVMSFSHNSAIDTAVVPTITRVTTGVYTVDAAIPSGYAGGGDVWVELEAQDFEGPVSLERVTVQVAVATADQMADNHEEELAEFSTAHSEEMGVLNTINTATGTTIPATLATIGADAYWAQVQFTRDQANTQDEYTVSFFKNSTRQTSGMSAVQIQVVKRADGTSLIAATNMTQIGSTGVYKYTASAERLTVGEAGIAVITWTQDAGSRSWQTVVGRDSA